MNTNNELQQDTNSNQPKQKSILYKTLPYLALIMAVVIAFQSWFIFKMHNENNQLNPRFNSDNFFNNPLSGSKDLNGLSLFPQDPFKDNYLYSPFDSSTWDPFQEMQRMRDQINSIFGDAFGRFSQSQEFGNLFDSESFTPNIDIQDEGDSFVIKIDLPGADASNVKVTCENQELKISGTIDQYKEDRKGSSLLRQERRSGHFSRIIPLPVPVESEKMETKIDKGVMTITIPKAQN